MSKKKRSLTDFEDYETVPSNPVETVDEEKNNETAHLSNTTNDVISDFQAKKAKKKRVEDTHRRTTFHVEKELLERLEKLSAKEGYGFKKYFINRVLKEALDEYEE